jgi:FMN-dependent oxidoreductase (nitrilotriacetate monooxygenase family)
MHIGLLLQAAVHHGGWRTPEAQTHRATDIDYYAGIARKAEAGKLDFLFWADTLSLFTGDGSFTAATEHSEPMRLMEPFTVMSALAMVTRDLGLVLTASTTYNEPYNLARKLASLDHVSRGRAGWNVVTSSYVAEASNFGVAPLPEHADRYARALDFVEATKALWDSIGDGAIVADKAAGRYFDLGRVHRINISSDHFTIAGPLNVPRPVQGHPVIVQAGSSTTGIDLAARHAEVVFTAGQTLENGQKFYAALKAAVMAAGRAADTCKVLPGIMPIIGKREADAIARRDQLDGMVHIAVALHVLSNALGGVNLSVYDLDGPLPDDLPPSNSSKSRRELMIDMARREKLTIRQLAMRAASAAGHGTVCGSAQQVADHMQEWFEDGAADGFVILPTTLPATCDDVVELLIPELQQRGLFRAAYEGRTLRDHLGLARPANRLE